MSILLLILSILEKTVPRPRPRTNPSVTEEVKLAQMCPGHQEGGKRQPFANRFQILSERFKVLLTGKASGFVEEGNHKAITRSDDVSQGVADSNHPKQSTTQDGLEYRERVCWRLF